MDRMATTRNARTMARLLRSCKKVRVVCRTSSRMTAKRMLLRNSTLLAMNKSAGMAFTGGRRWSGTHRASQERQMRRVRQAGVDQHNNRDEDEQHGNGDMGQIAEQVKPPECPDRNTARFRRGRRLRQRTGSWSFSILGDRILNLIVPLDNVVREGAEGVGLDEPKAPKAVRAVSQARRARAREAGMPRTLG